MKKSGAESLEDYAEVVRVLEKNLKYVEQLGMDKATIEAYRKILAFLRSRSDGDVLKILGLGGSSGPSSRKRPDTPALTDKQLHDLTSEEVLKFVSDDTLPRAFLETIAVNRFGLTKGGLSALRTRGALNEKLSRMLDHEETHRSIARVAGGPSDHAQMGPPKRTEGVRSQTEGKGSRSATDEVRRLEKGGKRTAE